MKSLIVERDKVLYSFEFNDNESEMKAIECLVDNEINFRFESTRVHSRNYFNSVIQKIELIEGEL